MQNYKVTYSTGKNEHVMELESESKEHARTLAREQLGLAIRIIDVVHVPESYELELF